MTDDDLPIIDCHHHFWDLSLRRHPWLAPDVLIPFRYGDYSSIKRDFMPDTYRAVTGPHHVVATVTMEGEWDADHLVEESAWMTGVAEQHGLPNAHVARAYLHRADAADVLAAQARYPIVRGIRHKPAAAPSPDRIEPGAPASMSDPAWRRGYGQLAPNGLHFELQAPWWHADELLGLIAAYPETPVVINHTFLPADRSPEALSGWRAAMKRAASAPQTTLKLSGIGLKGRPWSLDDNRAIIRDSIEIFGTDRCMFASNFPVDGLCGSFETIYAGYKQATADLAPADRLKLFHDNAIRVYRLNIKPLA